MSNYKHIKKAALLIWIDNGMINRYCSTRDMSILLDDSLKVVDQQLLIDIEQEASKYNDNDLDIICTGKDLDDLVSTKANVLLNAIFNMDIDAPIDTIEQFKLVNYHCNSM